MLSESKLAHIGEILNKMKEEVGVGGGLMRLDGVLIKSTIALPETMPMLISRAMNVSDAIMREVNDFQKEAEIAIDKDTIVIMRVGAYLFFGLAKSKEEKKAVIEYAKKAESVLG